MNKQEIEKAIMDLQEYIGSGEYNGSYPPIYLGTANMAISALEKQIPKKPKVMETTLVGEKFWWYCGHCGASRHTGSKANYCGYCGGKVDWRNYDE